MRQSFIIAFTFHVLWVATAMVYSPVMAQNELADLPSLYEMEAAVEKLAQQGNTAPLVRAMKSNNPFLQLTVLHSLKKHRVRLSIRDVVDVMRKNAASIQGNSEATAHEDFRVGLVDYSNSLTGLNLHFDPSQDDAIYMKLADEVEVIARSAGTTSEAPEKGTEREASPPAQTPKAVAAAPRSSAEPGYGWMFAAILLTVITASWIYLRRRVR